MLFSQKKIVGRGIKLFKKKLITEKEPPLGHIIQHYPILLSPYLTTPKSVLFFNPEISSQPDSPTKKQIRFEF
jgi:hypothetical protein